MKWIGLIALILMFSCSTTKKVEDLTENDIIISLVKEGCFGKCPIYIFTMYNGGYCEFVGKENTYKIGKHSLNLSKEKFKEIKLEFKNAKLFQYKDYYESSIPDLPTVQLYYKDKSGSKTIVGKRERPSDVHKLQFLLEQIAESREGWAVINGLVEEEKVKIDNTKIIIQLKDGGQLSRWFNNARETHGIRILKKLDDSYDKWVVSYNMKDYNPDEILNILKNDPNVSSAEFKSLNP